MSKFAVEVKPDRHEPGSLQLSITHNGYQWQGIGLNPEEAEKVIAALREFLGTPPEAEWIKVSERIPEKGALCFISDGKEFALAESQRIHNDLWWGEVGCGGRDFEFNFTPTHWKPAPNPSLPQPK